VRGGWETGTPKSRKSRRVVPLDSWLADDLGAYLADHPNRGVPTAPLFPNRQRGGTPNARAGLERAGGARGAVQEPVKPAVAAVGIAPTRLHDLRHTYAVLSLSAGAHYMQVSKWLGHESYVTTLTIYADYIDTEEGGKTPYGPPRGVYREHGNRRAVPAPHGGLALPLPGREPRRLLR
jgi:integrase